MIAVMCEALLTEIFKPVCWCISRRQISFLESDVSMCVELMLFTHPGVLSAGIGLTAAVVQTVARRRMMTQPTSLAPMPLASLAAQGTCTVIPIMLVCLP